MKFDYPMYGKQTNLKGVYSWNKMRPLKILFLIIQMKFNDFKLWDVSAQFDTKYQKRSNFNEIYHSDTKYVTFLIIQMKFEIFKFWELPNKFGPKN